MSLWDEDSPPEECEPFELGNLEKYKIKERLLGIALESGNEEDLLCLWSGHREVCHQGVWGKSGIMKPGGMWMNLLKGGRMI